MTEDGNPYPVATDFDADEAAAPTLGRDDDSDTRDTRKTTTKR